MLSLTDDACNNALLPESKGVLLACLTMYAVWLPCLGPNWASTAPIDKCLILQRFVTSAFLHVAHLLFNSLLPCTNLMLLL